MRCAAWLLAGLVCATPAMADTIRIVADHDATLIESSDAGLANGSGPFFFAGRTNQAEGSIRRALVHFDVAGALPEGAIIEDVALILFMTASNPAIRLYTLHRVQDDWSEGPASSSGGGGAPALPGDTTWLHRSFDTEAWRQPGGDFLPEPSARLEIGDTGSYTFGPDDAHGSRLRADVILWAAAPHRNFGWALLGDETVPQGVKSFASRENADPSLRPVLEITYRTAHD
jgi:hypothetical protein